MNTDKKRRTVLVTGFEAFGGETSNPSAEIARALDGKIIEGRPVVGAVLPCVFGTSAEELLRWLRVVRPELVVCVGQAGGRSAITPERVAINVDDALIPDNAGVRPVDVPILRGGPAPRRDTLFWHYPHHQHYQLGGTMPYAAIRAGDYKLIEFYNDLKDIRLELYNLRADIGETRDLAATEPGRVAEMRAQLHVWQREVGAQMPVTNPAYQPTKPEYTPPPAKAKKGAARG